MKIQTKLVKGYRVASGLAKNSPFPDGTIILQEPFFKALGLDLDGFFMGTLNLDITPYKFKIKHPKTTFNNVKWCEGFQAESFSFSECKILYNEVVYNALIYYPHAETKIGHFQNKSTMEIIAPFINNIEYGDILYIIVNKLEIEII